MPQEKSTASGAQGGIAEFRLGLAGLHLSDQKAIFNSLDPAIRAALWKDRIREALGGGVTAGQQKLLRQIAKRISPAVYDPRNRVERRDFIAFCRELHPRAMLAFAPDAGVFTRISTRLGDSDRVARLALTGLPSCTCSLAARETDADDCDDEHNCKRVPCVGSKTGCGSWWMQPCDGICR